MALPLWARALRVADRYAWYAYHAHEVVRDEVFLAWLAPEQRAELTVLAYSDLATYLPGGSTFEGGLFEWERVMFANALIPRTGRVLLAAAGGGRELKALCEAGYEVLAFEPNPRLFAGAESVARSYAGKARLLQARYADLGAAARGQGPLAALSNTTFDWVLFGWGSFTHVTEQSEQLAILRAVRLLAPNAPLALSFFARRKDASTQPSRSDRLRTTVRRFTRGVRARRVEPDGALGYEYGGGFVYRFTRSEFESLAAQAGYHLRVWDESAFPYAVLIPAV
jgi:hypothetical protein